MPLKLHEGTVHLPCAAVTQRGRFVKCMAGKGAAGVMQIGGNAMSIRWVVLPLLRRYGLECRMTAAARAKAELRLVGSVDGSHAALV